MLLTKCKVFEKFGYKKIKTKVILMVQLFSMIVASVYYI